MPIAAGRLRHRIEIQERVESTDEYGAVNVDWEKLIDTWASIRATTGREVVEADQRLGQTTYEIIIRERPIDNTNRIIWKGAVFDIEQVRIGNLPGVLKLICTQGTTNG